MKSNHFLTVACIALLISSCKKEEFTMPFPNNADGSIEATASANRNLPLTEKKNVQYGALIEAPSAKGSLDFQVNVAGQLEISCLRSRVIVPSTGSVVPTLNTAYKVLLNFNSGYSGTPLPFVADLTQYEKDLKSILSGFTVLPVVAVIENEESNRLYYSGTAQQYINQLMKAISVMHAYGIEVANGGITDVGLNYLVYQDFINQGKHDSAEQFRRLARVTPKSATTQERGAFVNTLLQAYARMDLDYVNFHWKADSPDTQGLSSVIAYLKKVTGRKIISNELGQFDSEPNTLTTHMQKCTDEDFPYIIWYSPDENVGRKAAPLQHSNATLTPSGNAYKGYPKG